MPWLLPLRSVIAYCFHIRFDDEQWLLCVATNCWWFASSPSSRDIAARKEWKNDFIKKNYSNKFYFYLRKHFSLFLSQMSFTGFNHLHIQIGEGRALDILNGECYHFNTKYQWKTKCKWTKIKLFGGNLTYPNDDVKRN